MNSKFFLLSFLALSTLTAKAQITLGSEDMPRKFQKYVTATIWNQDIQFDATAGSTEATWDLSDITYEDRDLDTTELVSPADVGYEEEFPDANIVMQNRGMTIMANSQEDGIYWLGGLIDLGPEGKTAIQFEGDFQYLSLPLAYGDKNVSEFSFEISNELGGNFSVDLLQNAKRSYDVNGHGFLKMGDGNSYEVLRIKVVEVDSGTTVIKSPMGERTNQERSYSYYYEFWANGFGQPLARVEVDSTDRTVVTSLELLDLQKTIVSTPNALSTNELSVFPNPAHTRLQVEMSTDIAEIHFFDLTSRKLIANAAYADGVDVSAISPGLYLIEAIDNKGSSVGFQKVLIQ